MVRYVRVLVFVLCVVMAYSAGAVLPTWADTVPIGEQPGSTGDPLVTKSYVDDAISKSLNGVSPSGSGAVVAKVLRLRGGDRVVADGGAQLIVRTGRAVVFSDGANGVADVTDGVDLKAGDVVPLNHLLIVPRAGRGVAVEAGYRQDVYVTVIGVHEVIKVE
jgi:hypothetical protein